MMKLLDYRPYLFSATAAIALAYGTSTSAQEVLTGDSRSACETILCLASVTQPDECSPSLNRFFSLLAGDRQSFLEKCPASQQTPYMSGLVGNIGQIVQYGAACNRATLAAQLNAEYQICQQEYTSCAFSYNQCINNQAYCYTMGGGDCTCTPCNTCNQNSQRAAQLCGAWSNATGGKVALPVLEQQGNGTYIWR
ncbi:TrbM/KikA/MpfK family conjugal transfer protein [uncultured Thiodictyon sp.]|uniref:TrbM/KikA/MpfK family conjugal transfer protein n=1 Tax=uncultured Thiodictyon sp. TaxID=1846217 RepID=UPI0025D26CDB|nr:TrbM/KikA/MpfK family conjugal transfer protein [uncultured Thiodictyon sp.]